MNSTLSKIASVTKNSTSSSSTTKSLPRYFSSLLSRDITASANASANTRNVGRYEYSYGHYANTITSSNHKTFSLSSTSSSSSSSRSFSTLTNLLKREIDEEASNPLNEIPQDLADLKKTLSTNWTIVDGVKTNTNTNDKATIKMYKKDNLPNGSKVTITFHCQDSLNPEELGFLQSAAEAATDIAGVEAGDGDEDDDDEEEEEGTPVKFDVMITRAGKVLHLSCTSEAAEASIDSVTVSPSEESLDDEDLYRGPMLEDLPEDVKDAFDGYLEDVCGINEDVAVFIAMYADYREQMEYINWLKGVKNIID